MSEKVSRIIMAIELIIIVLQFVLVFGYITLALLALAVLNLSESFFLGWVFGFVILVIPWSALISGTILMIAFIRNGSSGLRTAKPYLWRLSTIGTVLTITGSIIALIQSLLWSPEQSYQSGVSTEFGVLEIIGAFIVVSPLLIPYTHLLLERYLRKETEPS